MSDDDTEFDDVVDHGNITVDMAVLESCSVRKQQERDELSQQVDAFLASGGQINVIEPNVMADPPKKPTSNYGSQPI